MMYQGAQPVQTVIGPAPAPHVVVPTTQSTLNVAAVRGLGITQIIIGIVSVGCGIVAAVGLHSNWVNSVGYAIWAGIWIIITGILGVSSASNPNNRCLVGTSMAFNFVSTLISFSHGITYAIALWLYSSCSSYAYYYYNYYNYNRYYFKDSFGCNKHKKVGMAIYGVLLVCMIVEFFVALVAAILCRRACCSCCRGSSQSRGVVFQTQPQYVTTHTGQTNQGYPVTAGVMNPVSYNYQQQPQYQQEQPQLVQIPPNSQGSAQSAYAPPSHTKEVPPQ
ncbi:membrane-spanning 4-domains subfamily A member 8-like [Hydractinia symbiolongicarpus]|uniref:membrane-spanning 4-domains subfamily A member 8-like n=1 Tax=Hydractinia symbiolongicarpus TaxID=13093 RepID=UPI002550F8D3|nr:membrane-spanning 4-domains subfamily A member 8-like [Hydractinia symbiolongicarpus]